MSHISAILGNVIVGIFGFVRLVSYVVDRVNRCDDIEVSTV